MRIALLADIHGNLPALEAVLTELERLQPDRVLVNGDLINAVPYSAQVVERIRRLDWAVVRGNHEFYLLDFGTGRAEKSTADPARWGQLHWLVEQMTPAQTTYLAMLPDECTLYIPGTQPVRVAHGVPGNNRLGFTRRNSDEQIAQAIAHVAERTLVSAHTHVQLDRLIARPGENASWHVINPGSVGLPLNRDPRAQFALLENVPEAVFPGGWQVTHYRVAYDRRPALESYSTTGMWLAGGIFTQLFYWELVTAEAEIILFWLWARQNGYNPDQALAATFAAYNAATGRDQYVRERDPLHHRELP